MLVVPPQLSLYMSTAPEEKVRPQALRPQTAVLTRAHTLTRTHVAALDSRPFFRSSTWRAASAPCPTSRPAPRASRRAPSAVSASSRRRRCRRLAHKRARGPARACVCTAHDRRFFAATVLAVRGVRRSGFGANVAAQLPGRRILPHVSAAGVEEGNFGAATQLYGDSLAIEPFTRSSPLQVSLQQR